MQRDERGLELSTEDPRAATAVDAFGRDLLSLRAGGESIFEIADRHPDCCLLHVYAASAPLFAQDRAGWEAAQPYLRSAQALLGSATERERLLFAATVAWSQGRIEDAAEHLETVTARWPADLVAAKICEFHYYALGQHWVGRRFLAHMKRLEPDHAGSSHFLAMLAFAHELADDPERALEVGERALELNPDEAWAHHALGHVYLARSRPVSGLAALERYATSWRDKVRVIHSHNAWHLAVFHWARDDASRVWDVYRTDLGGASLGSVGEILDAVSILWRLELASEPVDDAVWSELGDRCEPRADDCSIPFVGAHLAYALARAGRGAAQARLLEASRAFAGAQSGVRADVWRRVGVPLILACAALGSGDARSACEHLDRIAFEIGCVGGSDAQDDLFRNAYLVALREAGRRADARAWLMEMLRGREPMPVEARWLERL